MQFSEVPSASLFLLLLKPVIKLTRTLTKIKECKILKMTHRVFIVKKFYIEVSQHTVFSLPRQGCNVYPVISATGEDHKQCRQRER